MRPICVDLFCGLGGWREGFLVEDYDCWGFDIERHDYGTGGYPGQLVLQDILTIHGSQFKDAAVIVASPPCQTYSWMAMPWSLAKAKAKDYRDHPEKQVELNALFNACFRIQREAIASAGRYIPMVVENVKGAQPWVGRAKAHYGSFYLWGDIAMHGNRLVIPGANKFGDGLRVPGRLLKQSGRNLNFPEKYGIPSPSFHGGAATKNDGGSWFGIGNNTESGLGQNPVNGSSKTIGHVNIRDGHDHKGPAAFGSQSNSRKAASAQIAKIPPPLSLFIARSYRPKP